ncbi:MAG: hypothetical protein N3D74_05565 [Caldisericia bacterium]|nr:hypothetical protein [Caldisericia bacterium]
MRVRLPPSAPLIVKMDIKEKIKEEIEHLSKLIEDLISGKEKNEEKISNLISLQTIIRGINQIILRVKNKSDLFKEILDLLVTQKYITGAVLEY